MGVPPLRGVLPVESGIGVSLGLGSSTRDATASLRAVPDAFDEELAPSRVAGPAVGSRVSRPGRHTRPWRHST
ncbi:hypothetical protein [Streptomyces decoyicus]